MEVIRPEGDNEWRHVCTSCKYVDYFNPKMVVGCIVEHDGKLLLCRRAIEPCRGKWTVPAGFLELRESTMAGAARETLEETGAQVSVTSPFMHLDIPAIGQSYLLFRASLGPPYAYAAGGTPESLEVALVAPEDIPWDQIAFSSVQIALRAYCDDLAAGTTSYHHGTIVKAPGSAPNDPASFELVDHFTYGLAPASAAGR
ncbi:MAG: NUDIX hydrolase domain-like protein [Monoraphidium minutum]|nr:MAG: NUDIX hydrolase domain-like protein [Monoraphidium minutum]